jgi:hypothetical protein
VRPTIALFAVLDIAAAATYLIATRPVRERLLREDELRLVNSRAGGSSAQP